MADVKVALIAVDDSEVFSLSVPSGSAAECEVHGEFLLKAIHVQGLKLDGRAIEIDMKIDKSWRKFIACDLVYPDERLVSWIDAWSDNPISMSRISVLRVRA